MYNCCAVISANYLTWEYFLIVLKLQELINQQTNMHGNQIITDAYFEFSKQLYFSIDHISLTCLAMRHQKAHNSKVYMYPKPFKSLPL